MATCRECKLWDIEAAKDKAGRVRKDRAAKCNWVSKEQWPESVMRHLNDRPRSGFRVATDGHRCNCFIKRDA